jgi:hypothetical protein
VQILADLGMSGRVTLSRSVTHWTTGDRIPGWCYNVTVDVSESVGGRIVVGNPCDNGRITRGVTGAVSPAHVVPSDVVLNMIVFVRV